MNRSNDRSQLEAMGLRLEPTEDRFLDLWVDLAVLVSAAGWLWLAVSGIEPSLAALAATPGGRVLAALAGVTTFFAIGRRRCA